MTMHHPLLTPMHRVDERVAAYREHARTFFHAVVLLPHACPDCAGRLGMTGPSRARCEACGRELDPTASFQRSPCCGKPLRLARTHYVCASCHTAVRSHFLFVERVFDAAYFRERMAESRARRRLRQEELHRLLAWEHAGAWLPDLLPGSDALDGLFSQLDALAGVGGQCPALTPPVDVFSLERYCAAIAESLEGGIRSFDVLPPLHNDRRVDRARRFVALVYLEHFRQVELRQQHDQILVIPLGTDYEG
jgi:hypothetical protein